MTAPQGILITAVAWFTIVAIGWLVVVPYLRRGPGRDTTIGILWHLAWLYSHLWQRVRFKGRSILPRNDDDHQGLIVVANHTGALDPMLVQSGCGFLIRWMMASEMMSPSLNWLWRDEIVVPVNRDGGDLAALRVAIRHVKSGGAIGIFPEGRITMPPRELRPFLTGIGLLVTRTKVPVLVAWISGTPDTNQLGEALTQRGHAHVEFLELIDFGDERDHAVIAETLRTRIQVASGWPLNDEVLPPGGE